MKVRKRVKPLLLTRSRELISLCLYFLTDDDDDGFLESIFCFILIRLMLLRVLVGVTSLNKTLCFDTNGWRLITVVIMSMIMMLCYLFPSAVLKLLPL